MRENEQEFGITSTSLETLVERSQVILICVRPMQAENVLQSLASMKISDKMFISILSGIKNVYFEKFLGSIPLIRAMPNIASGVGEGMTVLSPNANVHGEFQSFANILFKSMGEVVSLPESFMDLATGMTGSGPAFVFSLIEAVARLGEKEGIAYEKSMTMAAQTFLGAARILLNGVASIQQLLRGIAVPNGTTEAGLKMLRHLEIEKQFQSVIEAAAKRSKEISEEFF
jgi:pyrroline-5-carboxylate reductase